MKAVSYPANAVQRPATFFGIPPTLLMVVVAGVFVVFLFVHIIIGGAYGALWLMVSLPVGLALAWRAYSRDHHVETAVRTSRRFWHGRRRGVRVFLAGAAPPPRRRGKGSSRR